MNIDELITMYRKEGYSVQDAKSTICHDIILSKISRSNFREHITIKGGVVMHRISKSLRRATQDLDMDFIKYSLSDESIKCFIDKLNDVDDGFKIIIDGNIEELKQQNYKGKRLFIKIFDNYGNVIDNKIDLGIHNEFNIKQEEYFFNIDYLSDSVSLLINSNEQIFTEKLKSLLKLGFRSGRYKDLFDFYYLIKETNLDKKKILKCFNIIIYQDKLMKEENIGDIYRRLERIFSSPVYKSNLNNVKNNWLSVDINEAINLVLNFIDKLSDEVITFQ